MPDPQELVTKEFEAVVEKAANGSHDAKFILSASTPDRVRDTIDPEAYDAVAAKTKKLIALFNHNKDAIAGYWTDLKREKDTLTAYIKFASTNVGQMLKTLIDEGVPLGASIGFRGKGDFNDQGGIHFTALDLFETSLVSTPAHPRAVQIAKQFNVDLRLSEEEDPTSGDAAKKAIHEAKSSIAHLNLTMRK